MTDLIETQILFDAKRSSDINAILDENSKVITIISGKENISLDDAKQLFTDTIKFLYLCSISEKSLAPTEKLDIGWHHFILCTKEYAQFCRRHIGRFIHHSPFTEAQKMNLLSNPIEETISLANLTFESLSENWKIGNLTMKFDDLGDCNGKCSGEGSCSDEGNCTSECKGDYSITEKPDDFL